MEVWVPAQLYLRRVRGPGSRWGGAKSSLGPAFDDSALPRPPSRSGDSREQLPNPISSFLQLHPQEKAGHFTKSFCPFRRKWEMVFAVKAPVFGEQTPALWQCRAPGSCVEHSAKVMKSQHRSNHSTKMRRAALSLHTGDPGAVGGSGGFFLDLLRGDSQATAVTPGPCVGLDHRTWRHREKPPLDAGELTSVAETVRESREHRMLPADVGQASQEGAPRTRFGTVTPEQLHGATGHFPKRQFPGQKPPLQHCLMLQEKAQHTALLSWNHRSLSVLVSTR
ncbi:hypothetical protein P7K49_001552 [Saguinus oedipus]|uniref:Uncharacterized protein n=1 Tax=Saguinus oedipus TaxID=9490 RepID=A0ABQ9WEU9_SAGOE|nr:hypothetical protein P7K49_001552 [Saguinus oedipus]